MHDGKSNNEQKNVNNIKDPESTYVAFIYYWDLFMGI